MRWRQLGTLIWLRWRLTANMLRRMSAANSVLTAVVIAVLALSCLSSFVTALVAGSLLLPMANSDVILVIWNIAAGAFLFFMLTGLVADMQRSDVQSLQQFLHLPVSPWGAFLISYVGSWLTISTFFFMPTLLALATASIWSRGAAMVLLPILLLGFFLLLTAAIHQLRGWLASLMTNPRRRRRIVAIVIALFVLLAQAPGLLNLWFFKTAASGDWRRQRDAAIAELAEQNLPAEQLRQRTEQVSDEYRLREASARNEKIGATRNVALWVERRRPVGMAALRRMGLGAETLRASRRLPGRVVWFGVGLPLAIVLHDLALLSGRLQAR